MNTAFAAGCIYEILACEGFVCRLSSLSGPPSASHTKLRSVSFPREREPKDKYEQPPNHGAHEEVAEQEVVCDPLEHAANPTKHAAMNNYFQLQCTK